MLFWYGVGIGLLNGFFGSGGGILAVTLLKKQGLQAKQAHATSLAVILPLSVISLFIYQRHGNLNLGQTLPFLLPALTGSLLGSWGLKKIPVTALKLIFSLLILYSSVRMLLS